MKIDSPEIVGESNISPAGIIQAFAGASVPTGWLECNGAAISRTTYANLFTNIGENWGEGDGSTTFNLPDLRGKFLRGYDHGEGNDPDAATRTAQDTGGNTGDNVGSVQGDAMQRITGTFQTRQTSASKDLITTWTGVFSNGGGTSSVTEITDAGGGDQATKNEFDSSTSTSPNTAKTSDYETRPINASVMYIIKT